MRPLGKLKDIQVRAAGIGVLSDGGGLVLSVKQGTTRVTDIGYSDIRVTAVHIGWGWAAILM